MIGERYAILARRIVTCDPARATPDDPLGAIDGGAVVVEKGTIADVGSRAEVLAKNPGIDVAIDAEGVVTPGLVDAHTHAAWVGSRDGEYAMRMAGADYEAIAAKGGGIAASSKAIREASLAEVVETLRARLRRMAALGVTTVEVKSGYGLDEANERKQLEAAAEVSRAGDLPRIVPTYLALHALPKEAGGDREAYAHTVMTSWLPAIAAAKLAAFVDAYIDRSAFSVDQARGVLSKARELGLGVRAHVGQFADVGGAELAAELGAASVDHLEQVSPRGIEALASRGVRAVLLPIASFTLRQSPPPIEALRAAGVKLVVASDANPGTAPTESLPLALAMAIRSYELSIPEAILGVTREAAASLSLGGTCGELREGLRADLVIWDLPHENAIAQPWGGPRTRAVIRDGVPIMQAGG